MDEKKPMVTITLPCYNHEKFIRESIESVLAQTYQDYELIIIENGSTDGCREIIKEYEGRERIRIIYFDVNDQYRSEQVFRQEMRGEYCAFMTSDDIWLPDKLEKQVTFMEANQDYQICFTWAEYGDENMKLITDGNCPSFKVENRTTEQWIYRLFMGGNCLCAPSILLRAATYRNIQLEGVPFWQLYDEFEWLQCLMKGKAIYVVEEVLVYMRQHGNAISFSESASIRAYNERGAMYQYVFENISDEQYRMAFAQNLVRKEAYSVAEITCEKILLLFRMAEQDPSIQIPALNFFYSHFGDEDVAHTFSELYGLNKKFFLDKTTNMGLGRLLSYYYQHSEEEKNRPDNLQKDYSDTLKLLINCYRQVITALEEAEEAKQAMTLESLDVANDILQQFKQGFGKFEKLLSQEEWERYLGFVEECKREGCLIALLPWLYRICAYLEAVELYGK